MNKEKEKEFEGLLDIDETRLDQQSAQQPRLVWQYGRLMAKALRELDGAEAELKVIAAELDEDIRSNPMNYSMEKVTESGIKNALPRTKEYREAARRIIAAKYRVNILSAANKALEHRRTSLSQHVGLHEQNYFSRPRKPSIDREKSPHRKPLKRRRKDD